MEEALKVISCKHAGSTTAVQQACDVCPAFKVIKTFCKNTTAQARPNIGYKGLVVDIIRGLHTTGQLNLDLPIRKALIDHIVTAPDVFTTAMREKNLMKGFIENGMIDKNTLTYPDFKKLLQTCKLSDFKREYEDLIVNNFNELYELTNECGHIPEDVFNRLGFPKDTDYDGDTVERQAAISNEMQQRAKIISHKFQRKLRTQKEVEAREKVHRDIIDELKMKHEIHQANDTCEDKLFKVSQLTAGNFEDIPMSSFAHRNVTIPLLTAFVYCRLYTVGKPPRGRNNKIPSTKGKLENAAAGDDNLIRAAFECRGRPKVLSRPEICDDGNPITTSTVAPTTNINAAATTKASSTPPLLTKDKPSTYLEREGYIMLAVANIKGVFNIDKETVNAEMKIRADKIGTLLKGRLEMHITNKIKDQTKHNHYSLNFTRNNLNRVVAVMCFVNHMTHDPDRAGRNTCLLKHPSNGSFIQVNDPKIEGSYLHYYSVDCEWVRSGKAVGSDVSVPHCGLKKRNIEHEKMARKSRTVDGRGFYTMFPTRDNPNGLQRVGFFDDMVQYVGLGFEREKNIEGLVSNENDMGLFDWTGVLDKLEATNIRGCETLKEKQLVLVGYLFELCYDLCLSGTSNVSNNPGFESVLGIFNNAKEN